ncbi:hypothetical protein [Xanthomonas massiliensis]|jgi:hypothetical protein|uniref:hypothetical protein n=1 Tax=Xanthomonas massiliensis TaxID=1720302 RepID=UPI0008265F29|nr:hypothetical protein [Xanthomonas massiliensis]
MKKLLALSVLLAACLLVAACGGSSPSRHESRAERSQPRVSIGGTLVTLRRPPAPNVDFLIDGTVKIDDIALPLPEARKQETREAFLQWQMLRQQAINDGRLAADARGVPVQAPPALQALQQQLMQDIPELRPYAPSFAALKAEWH